MTDPETTPADAPHPDHPAAVLAAIEARRSTKKFSDLPPTRAQLESLLRAAVCAPDHGRLAPWRFAVLQGPSRAVFADALAAALRGRMPEVAADAVEREREKAFRSPVLIVVSAHAEPHPKVPEVEQWVAVGAAIQNLWLAAVEMGLGLAWKTGNPAYDPVVKEALGVPEGDAIIGFLHVGTPLATAPPRTPDAGSRTRWL
ncbi:MAG: nitroreductase [Gammaproteobacteria bacterium]